MKRLPAALLTALLAVSVAACGDKGSDKDNDKGNDKDNTSSASTSDSTPSAGATAADAGPGSRSAEVKAYCAKIDAFVGQAQKTIDSQDAGKAAELSQKATELATAAGKLTDVSAQDAKVLTDCSNKAAKALQDLATNMGS